LKTYENLSTGVSNVDLPHLIKIQFSDLSKILVLLPENHSFEAEEEVEHDKGLDE
jgi:hypothetical protein